MAKCNKKCEVYSRVTGYFRPVANWNRSKKEEFIKCKTYRSPGALALAASAAALLLSGCSTAQKLAEGLSDKSISGSGTVSIQRVGIDDETKTPVLKSTVITGDYASAREGDYALQYRRRRSPSIWNSAAVSEEVTINCIGTREAVECALELVREDAPPASPQKSDFSSPEF